MSLHKNSNTKELREACESLSQNLFRSMQTSEEVSSILQVLMNGTKETRSYLSEAKSKVDSFIGTLSSKEEQKLEHIPPSKLEQILSQNSFKFKVTAQSEYVKQRLDILIDINTTNMFICDNGWNKFSIRNREDLSIKKTI